MPYGLVLAHVDCLSRYESRSPKKDPYTVLLCDIYLCDKKTVIGLFLDDNAPKTYTITEM